MEKYYYNTGFKSEIKDQIFTNRENYFWHTGRFNNQFQVKNFEQTLIQQDNLLNFIHPLLKGELKFFKFPPMTHYRWHCDGQNIYNLNLTFKKQNSFVFFKSLEGDYDRQDTHAVLHSIKSLDYEPEFWYLFQAQISHTIFNLDQETRYLLTYNVYKGCKISYNEILVLIKEFKEKQCQI